MRFRFVSDHCVFVLCVYNNVIRILKIVSHYDALGPYAYSFNYSQGTLQSGFFDLDFEGDVEIMKHLIYASKLFPRSAVSVPLLLPGVPLSHYEFLVCSFLYWMAFVLFSPLLILGLILTPALPRPLSIPLSPWNTNQLPLLLPSAIYWSWSSDLINRYIKGLWPIYTSLNILNASYIYIYTWSIYIYIHEVSVVCIIKT